MVDHAGIWLPTTAVKIAFFWPMEKDKVVTQPEPYYCERGPVFVRSSLWTSLLPLAVLVNTELCAVVGTLTFNL